MRLRSVCRRKRHAVLALVVVVELGFLLSSQNGVLKVYLNKYCWQTALLSERALLPEGTLPRIVLLEGDTVAEQGRRVMFAESRAATQQDSIDKNDEEDPRKKENEHHCVLEPWQTESHPNCNDIHLRSMGDLLIDSARYNVTKPKGIYFIYQGGGNRISAKLREHERVVIYKTLRYQKDFTPQFFEFNRVESMATAMLRRSTPDIYSYCGMSSLTQLGDMTLDGIRDAQTLEPAKILKYAAGISRAVASMHSIDNYASLVHRDLDEANIVLVQDQPKIIDFHASVFIGLNRTSQQPCFPYKGISSRNMDTFAPELMTGGLLDDKVDVYGLGAMLFYILTKGVRLYHCERPKGICNFDVQNNTLSRSELQTIKENGKLPQLPEDVEKSKDPAIRAVREAMYQAVQIDPKKRPRANIIAENLERIQDELIQAKLEKLGGREALLLDRQYMNVGDRVRAPIVGAYLELHPRGKLCLYKDMDENVQRLWCTPKKSKTEICNARLQADGNLVIREGSAASPGSLIWTSNSSSVFGANYFLAVDQSESISIYRGSPESPGDKIWSSAVESTANDLPLLKTPVRASILARRTVDISNTSIISQRDTAAEEKSVQSVEKSFPLIVFLGESSLSTLSTGYFAEDSFIENRVESFHVDAVENLGDDIRTVEDLLNCERVGWQSLSFPTCNDIHSRDMANNLVDEKLVIIGEGSSRLAWRSSDMSPITTLKTFRGESFSRSFDEKNFEKQRVDALAMERLTASPFVVNINAYCGMSVSTDHYEDTLLSFESPMSPAKRLKLAAQIARGLADIHSLEPRLVHNDVKASHVVVAPDGRPHFNDFNSARMLMKDNNTGGACTFQQVHPLSPQYRSPEEENEERNLTEKIDIYRLGHLLYIIVVGGQEWLEWAQKERMERNSTGMTTPPIPYALRQSADPSIRAILNATMQCYHLDPIRRPSAAALADYLQHSFEVIEEANESNIGLGNVALSREAESILKSNETVQMAGFRIHPHWHPRHRSERFPSVEERVKLYMSNWYYPPCDETSSFVNSYNVSSNDSWPMLHVRNPWDSTSHETQVLDSKITHHFKFLVDRRVIMDCARSEERVKQEGKLPSESRISLRRNLMSYCSDFMDMVDMADQLDNQAKSFTPLVASFGDSTGVFPSDSVDVPFFAKFRAVATKKSLDRVTKRNRTCWTEGPKPLKTDFHLNHYRNRCSPILWRLESNRHWNPLKDARQVDTPWEKKKNLAIWRGVMTGQSPEQIPGDTDLKHCQKNQRCKFVLDHADSKLVDCGLTDHLGRLKSDSVGGRNLIKPMVDMSVMQQYKVIISMEGNDVASGLKWNLQSQSVVLMPPPTRTSWAMEEMLEPWVHYIPMLPDGSDAEEKVQWVLAHDREAQRIAERATLFIHDFLYHGDAEMDNRLVKQEIARRYRAHWS